MKYLLKRIKYITPLIFLLTLSCGLSNDLMDGMDEYNTNADISISDSLATDAFYNNDKFTVVCTPSESGFTVKYTTDGTDPSRTSGTEYTAPITIDTTDFTAGTIEIRAVAYDANRISGIVNTFVTLGDGTAANPYDIATPVQLENISLNVNAGTHNNSNFRQIADIDLSTYNTGGGWVPIGIAAHPFSGNYDGGIYVSGSYSGSNYSIDNMTISRASSDNQGLFGYVAANAELRNITLTNVNVTGAAYTGALAGNINGSGATINNCDITGSSEVNGTTDVGGLIGYVTDATVIDSDVTVTVTGIGDDTGGLIGYCYNTNVTNCHSAVVFPVAGTGNNKGGLIGIFGGDPGHVINSCTSSGSVTGINNIGGLVGDNGSASNGGTIENNCSSSADVIGTGTVGGLVGVNSNNGIINSSHATGNVEGTGDSIGGLVGLNENNAQILNSDATGEVKKTDLGSNTGGLVGYNSSLFLYAIQNSHATGSVSGTNNVGGLVGYNAGEITQCWYTPASATYTITGNEHVGGLVGQNTTIDGVITKCYSTGNVNGNNYVGGFVGLNESLAQIRLSYAEGSVTGTGNRAGGFAGQSTSTNNPSIENCYSTGDVNSSGTNYGGFIGEITTGTVTNCYSAGNVTGGGTIFGGFVGLHTAGVLYNACYWLKDLLVNAGITDDSGSSGDLTNVDSEDQTAMRNTATFSGWNFTLIWNKDPLNSINNGYPYLR